MDVQSNLLADISWVILFLALIGAWVVVRTVLRLTLRVFFMGCSALLVLAVVVVVLRWFNLLP